MYRTRASANKVQLYTLKTVDVGLSRMLLWWTWKMGVVTVNEAFYPAATQGGSGLFGKIAELLRLLFEGGGAKGQNGMLS